jgi:hypothetical protein
MQSFTERVLTRDADIDAIAAWLDALPPEARAEAALSIGPKAQRALWALARGRAVQMDELVPPDRGDAPVHHLGRNSQPLLSSFEKRMRRPTSDASVLWGYNEGVTRRVIGPGYFVVRDTDGDSRGAVVVDYYQVPPETPAGWPEVRANEQGLQRFVFREMHDFLRRVSTHVTIGRAYKRDRRTPHCFVLCRAD